MSLKDRDVVSGEETGDTRILFRVVSVFDRTQVAPIEGAVPAPLEPPCEPLIGDTHAHLLGAACDFARSLGYEVSFEATPAGVGGFCDRKARRIVVDAGLAANAQLRTLVHETSHALGVDYERFSREQAEVIVDTYCVLGSVGLDVGGESVPYIAGWGEDGALDAIREYAQTIDTIAGRIEDALGRKPEPAEATSATEAIAA